MAGTNGRGEGSSDGWSWTHSVSRSESVSISEGRSIGISDQRSASITEHHSWHGSESVMMEEEWLVCNDIRVLARTGRRMSWGPYVVSRMRICLFLCARCRRYWNLLTDERARKIVETVELQGDRLTTVKDIQAILRSGKKAHDLRSRIHEQLRIWVELPEFLRSALVWMARPNTSSVPDHVLRPNKVGWSEEEYATELQIFQDITGNPFRPVAVEPGWLAWNGGTVVQLAKAIYEERGFERMPILADALEEAGCTNADILSHCRGAGPHARGCWVLDLLLGKETCQPVPLPPAPVVEATGTLQRSFEDQIEQARRQLRNLKPRRPVEPMTDSDEE